MMPAPVQNPTSVASSRFSPGSFHFLVLALVTFSCSATFLYGQSDTSATKSSAPPGDSMTNKEMIEILKNLPGLVGPEPEANKKRQWLMGGLNVIGYGTSIVIFNNQWYKEYPKTSFHTFNDSKEWLQMDKIGHGWAAYNAGLASAAMWEWTGIGRKKAAWIGGLSSTVYLTVIEVLDAHSAKWGWSWADMGANIFGSGLFISQQLGWQEQRVKLKFSFHRKDYGEAVLNERADKLFGEAWTERMLKDYNGQTYWLSANLRSFFPKSNLPPWLNIAVGYGADGMFGGFENKWDNGDPGFPIDRTDIKRYRQWYLAPDINFSAIQSKKRAVRILLAALDAFKFPAPSLELSNGKVRINAIHF